MIRAYIDTLLPEKLNRGTLTEIPQICIDAFSESPTEPSSAASSAGIGDKLLKKNFVSWTINRAYFLTHYDEAVLLDILNMDFLNMLLAQPDDTVRLYMHELSYEFLLYSARKDEDDFEHVFSLLLLLKQKSKIMFLEVKHPITLIFPMSGELKCDVTVQITTISAGHNCGSVMLLIERIFPIPDHSLDSSNYFEDEEEVEEDEQRILYTGNCRLLLSDLSNCSAFYHKCGDKKVITSLYADTTFCVGHVEELPSRKSVEAELVEIISQKLAEPHIEDPIHIEIWTPGSLAGNLHFIQTLFNQFRQTIHVPKRLGIFLEQIPNFKKYWKCSIVSQQFVTFHYCCKAMEDVEVCPKTNDINVLHVSLQCNMFRSPVEPTEDETQLIEGNSVYFKQPDIYRAIYSTHLSKCELARMVNFLEVDPMSVKPLYRPRCTRLTDVNEQLKSACIDVIECQPTDFDEDEPSTVFDFTAEVPILPLPRKKLDYYVARTRTREFIHYYPDDLMNSMNPDLNLSSRKKTRHHHGEGDVLVPRQLESDSPRFTPNIEYSESGGSTGFKATATARDAPFKKVF